MRRTGAAECGQNYNAELLPPPRTHAPSKNYLRIRLLRSLGSRVVSVLDSGAEGLGSNRSRDAVA